MQSKQQQQQQQHVLKKSFLGCFLVNDVFKPWVALEDSVFQNAISCFIFKKFYFTSRSTANLLTVIGYSIARVLKTSGAA